MFQTNQIFLINKFIQVPFYSKKANSEIVRLSFFQQFFYIFGIFLSYFSSCILTVIIQVCSRPIIYFFINKFISSAVLQRKSDFRNCQTQFFLATFFMKFLEFFWSYFSSCIFTVIIQVCSRPIIYFSSISSYQVPFYSEKAISEIVRLSFFFSTYFLEIFGIFLVIFFFMHFHSDYSSRVPDQSYILHQ